MKNDGYCGEVSAQMAALKHGNWLSQYDIRALAHPQRNEEAAQRHQLLVGNTAYPQNDEKAAAGMHLKYEYFPRSTESSQSARTAAFMSWIKASTRRGHVPNIGIYCKGCGHTEYDHIVSVLSYESDHDDDEHYASDWLVFGDHIGVQPAGGELNGNVYRMSLDLESATFGSRAQADSSSRGDYTIPNDSANYGLAHTGVVDPSSELLPVRLSTGSLAELPPIEQGQLTRPPPAPLTLTANVSGLDPLLSTRYVLLAFREPSTVPDSSFLRSSHACALASFNFTAAGQTHWSTTITIQTCNTLFLRAVIDDGSGAPPPCPSPLDVPCSPVPAHPPSPPPPPPPPSC